MHETDLERMERGVQAIHLFLTVITWVSIFAAVGLMALAVLTYLTSQSPS